MKITRLFITAFIGAALCGTAIARDRPETVFGADLAGPWVVQLRQPDTAHGAGKVVARKQTPRHRSAPEPAPRAAGRSMDPVYLPQVISYSSAYAPGTIVIDTPNRFLYLVLDDGQARRYGVGVGRPGFEWAGVHRVSQKRTWPDWRPPPQMIACEKKKGHILPNFMAGGPDNPLGARALYLGSTLYRIHGTNQPWTIGRAVSSGCIRMRNEDVVDLYERVGQGTRVVVM